MLRGAMRYKIQRQRWGGILDNQTWIYPNAVFSDGTLHHDLGLCVEAGKIAQTCRIDDLPETASVSRIHGIVAPGFVDVQVNGGGGILVNTATSADQIVHMRNIHRNLGTYAILPTVITDGADVIERCAEMIIDTKDEDGLIGLHIEGPHISVERRGTHDQNMIRPFDDATKKTIQKLRAQDIFVKLTVAPEAITTNQITELAEMGVVISIGHTAANDGQTRQALSAGATCFTHLFNAMPPIYNRDPGPVVTALNSDAYCGLICDGVHVSYDLIAMAIRSRPVKDRMFLVTDAMPTVGGPDQFELYDQIIHVEDGRLINAEGSLAGAHVTQLQGVSNLVNHIGISAEQAFSMAITVPADLVKRPEFGSVLRRPLGDLILCADDFSACSAVSLA